MPGLDNRATTLDARSSSVDLLKNLQITTGKSVASPYFSANEFAFAYAKA